MKFISFNINGIRARKHQIAELIKLHDPDVIGFQETKVHDDQFPLEDLLPFGYHISYFGQKAHYGVAILTKEKPLDVRYGLPTDTEDAQRRLIMVDIPTSKGEVTVINGYFPQGESRYHETKFPAKLQFYRDLHQYVRENISTEKMTMIMGDMNICPTDLDVGLALKSQQRWLKLGRCAFLPEERELIHYLMSLGFIDTYRAMNQSVEKYSWFDYRFNGFEIHEGLRIDLILANKALAQYCTGSGIDYDIRAMEKPSDHAPVWTTFDFNR